MSYIIIGAGGGGRTVVSILERNHNKNICFLDDKKHGEIINDYKVINNVNNYNYVRNLNNKYIVAFGSLCITEREILFNKLNKLNISFFNAIDPSVIIDRTAELGKGCTIAGNCVINPNAKIGDNCFLCVNTTVDHDSILGNNTYCSPGVNIAGGAKIGNNVFLGTNCTILPCVIIGNNSIIGAGSVIINNIEENTKVVGNPGKYIK